MGEMNMGKIIMSEEMEPDFDVKMETIVSLGTEPSDKVNKQKNMDCEIGTYESTDRLSDETTVVGKEEGEDIKLDNQTRDSIIKKPSPDHKVTVRSRYRRASTGSCHDACKYGHKHEFEKTPKKPLLGTIRENRPLTRTNSGGNLARTMTEKDSKDKELNRRLSLPGPAVDKVPRNPSSQNEGPNSSKNVTSTESKLKHVKTEVKSPLVRTPWTSFGRSKIDIPAVKKNPKEKSSQKDKESNSEEAGGCSENKKVKAKETAMNSPRIILKKSGSIRARLYKDFKSLSRSRRQSTSTDVLEQNASNPSAKSTLKSSLQDEESPSSPRDSRSGKPRKSNVTKKGTRFGLPSFSLTSASKSASSGGRRTSQTRGDFGLGLVTEEGASTTNTPRSKAKKTGISRSEEKDSSAWKVKFRRGTVVNLQVASNSPRKLRFKRGRILGEDPNGKGADKSLKKSDGMGNDLGDTRAEHEKVQLRRQEGSAKKDNVDMNNVIEETASKLVKTRKGKVKALVGAFETVMSFRDRKPLVETSAS